MLLSYFQCALENVYRTRWRGPVKNMLYAFVATWTISSTIYQNEMKALLGRTTDRPKISWYNSFFFIFNSSRTNKETQNKTKQYRGKIGNIIENNDGEYKIHHSKWSGLPVIYLLSAMISPLAIRHMMAALSNVHNMNPPRILYQMVWWNFHFHNKIRDSAFEMRGKLISNYINRNLIQWIFFLLLFHFVFLRSCSILIQSSTW